MEFCVKAVNIGKKNSIKTYPLEHECEIPQTLIKLKTLYVVTMFS